MKSLIVLAAASLVVLASSGATAQQPSTSWAVPEGARQTEIELRMALAAAPSSIPLRLFQSL